MSVAKCVGIGGRRHRRQRRARARCRMARFVEKHSGAAAILGAGFLFHASLGLEGLR